MPDAEFGIEQPLFATESGHAALHALRSWVQRTLGITYSDAQFDIFADRIATLCRDLGSTPTALYERIQFGDVETNKRLAEAVSTNYTFFFRETESFDYIEQKIFPRLPPGPLRFWSAATSSGEEAYSLAMLSRRYFGPDSSRIRVLGTDVSERQICAAEAAVYPTGSLNEATLQRASAFFTTLDAGQVRVSEEIRGMCTFRRMNLLAFPWPFEQKFHLILLRNVLYYMSPEDGRRVLLAGARALAPQGYLTTSLTEPLFAPDYSLRQEAPSIYRQP
ncbi:MAG TPA: CheR family methyltransferase [Polyangiaceae bacterium]|nr:CheR family methyltransferase [Polyangiaceae bacterium]